MHTPVFKTFLEAVAGIGNAFASCLQPSHGNIRKDVLMKLLSYLDRRWSYLDVVDANANMPETLRWLVAIMRFVVRIIFRPIIVSQLDYTFTVGPVVGV